MSLSGRTPSPPAGKPLGSPAGGPLDSESGLKSTPTRRSRPSKRRVKVRLQNSIRAVLDGRGRLEFEAGGGLRPSHRSPAQTLGRGPRAIFRPLRPYRVTRGGRRGRNIAPARAPVTIDNKEFSQFAKSVKDRAAGSRSVLSTCRTSPRWPREAQMGPHSDQISARPNPPSKPPILDLLFVPVENRDFRSVSTSLSC